MRNRYLGIKSLEEANQLIDKAFKNSYKQLEVEEIKVRDSLGQIVQERVYSKYSSPSFHSCAIGGVMAKSQKAITARGHKPLTLSEDDFAYCDTGDPLVKLYDAVIMIEDIPERDDEIIIQAPVHPWENVHPVGEDIIEKDLVSLQFHQFIPVDPSIMLSAGLETVKVLEKPRIAIIPTGDEIVSGDESSKIEQIIESNSAMFVATIEEMGVQAEALPIIKDDRDLLRETVAKAIEDYDLVLMNTGSSVSRDDYTSSIVQGLGQLLAHGISIKPGRPTVTASIQGKPFIGIPGYPVSGHIVFQKVIQPLLEKRIYLKTTDHAYLEGQSTRPVIGALKNTEYVRAKIGKIKDKLLFTPMDCGAGSSYSLSQSNGYLTIPRNSEGYLKGQYTRARPYDHVKVKDLENHIINIGSYGIVLDLINNFFAKEDSDYRFLSSYVGSLAGLNAPLRGNCHLVPSRLLGKDGSCNNEAVSLLFKGQETAMIQIIGRRQGFIVERGNPKNMHQPPKVGPRNPTFGGLLMAKYSYGLKKKIVEEYLCGKTSYQALVMKHQIEKSVLRLWIGNYKNYGDEDSMRSRNNRAYSVELKLEAITHYETSEYSY